MSLHSIAAGAATLSERLSGHLEFLPLTEADREITEARLAAWQKAAGGDDPARFARRLAREGLSEDAARQILGPVRWPEGRPLPPWIKVLEEAITLSRHPSEAEKPGLWRTHLNEPIPFAPVLWPFVLAGRARLAQGVGENLARLSPAARGDLECDLLARLSRLAGRVLFAEFSLLRQRRQGGFALLFSPGHGQIPDDLYREFTTRLRGERLLEFLEEYPALARLLALTTLFWTEEHAEMLARLATDWPDITGFFPDRRPGDEIASVEPSLSDPHNHGRTVCVLTFASGWKLVYKPRDLGVEVAFSRLLAWLNDRRAPVPFRPIQMLNRATHGWVEHFGAAPCADVPGARRFHERAGALLCLLYVLDATDCHHGNVLAHNDHPMLIDLEALLSPFRGAGSVPAGFGANLRAQEIIWASVSRTALLPGWLPGNVPGEAFDVGGLAPPAKQIAFRVPRWEQANTDAMMLRLEPLLPGPQQNIPLVSETDLGPEERASEIVTGFRQTWDFVRARKEELLAPDGPLGFFAGRRSRLVARATQVYTGLLMEALKPEFLRQGIDRSIKIESLARAMAGPEDGLVASGESDLWPLWRAERESLERHDIPYFLNDVESSRVRWEAGETDSIPLNNPALQRARECLARLDDTGREHQAALIHGAFWMRRAGDNSAPAPVFSPVRANVTFQPGDFLNAANRILRETTANAIRGDDGSATWIASQTMPDGSGCQRRPLGPELYDGLPGVALWLAAASRVTGDPAARELSLASLWQLREVARSRDGRRYLAAANGLGGGTGIGGIIYGLTIAGSLLGEPALQETALPLLDTINPGSLAQDQVFDLVQGAAGMLVSLLALHATTGKDAVLDKARLCVKHLLAGRTPLSLGPRAWPRHGRGHQIGFSHGAAGIAFALLQYFRVAADQEAFAAAQEAIDFERVIRGQAVDIRPSGGQAPMNAWCHGLTGVALGKLATLDLVDDAQTRAEIEAALATILNHGVEGPDLVCCGHLGRVELLLTAARVLQRPALLAVARAHTAAIIERAGRTGGFTLHPSLPPMLHNPGWFTGTSGVGYMLLRVLYPDRLPAPLLWEHAPAATADRCGNNGMESMM